MILEVEKLDLYYGDAQALDSVSLSAEKGELVAIVGSNGAGKSSLIRAIAGIEKPRAGAIRFAGQNITGLPSHRICNLGIGQVAEGRQIFPSLTVEENLQMGALLPRARHKMRSTLQEVYALLPRLAERRGQLAGTMSGGEQQMLAIGRCLMGHPELIMLDEPSLGLAPALVQELFRTVRELNRRGLSILLVEQNVAASLKLASRAYVLENGRVVIQGTGSELLHDDRVRQAYMGVDAQVPASVEAPSTKAPFRPVAFAPPRVDRRQMADGGFELASPVPLGAYEHSLAHMLRRQAKAVPDSMFLAERDPSGVWRRVTYGLASERANALGQALLERGCGPKRPLMILSGNSIDHALLTFGAFVAGVPVVPISVPYSLMSADHGKLRYIFELVKPGVIYAADGAAFTKALRALNLDRVCLVVGDRPPDGIAAEAFPALLETVPGREVEAAYTSVGADTVAKILFTSGSTGMPKGVINTHRMLCSNQKMLEQVWPFLSSEPPVFVDWLPWNHTFGGNHNFNMVLAHGGALYIDTGRPTPDLVGQTVRNLAEIAPTIYFNVPAGYSILLPHLETNEQLARTFFSRLRVLLYAGASLSQDLWDRLEALSTRVTGHRVPIVSSWGATETSPAVTGGHLLVDRAGIIGLPLPGVTLRFVPNGAKFELRVKGPNVFPGYWEAEDLTREAFDADGFYKIGDAGRLADENDPAQGIVFDGRVAEDFKLATGTWVNAGSLRLAALQAAAPALQDAVVTGHDRDCVALLAWPNFAALRQICSNASVHDDSVALLHAAEVIDHIRQGIAAHNARQTGTSTIIRRVLLLSEPPSIDANEITDKGYVNQRAVLERRRDALDRLYAVPPPDEVIIID